MKTYEQRMKSIQNKAKRMKNLRFAITSVITSICVAVILICGLRFGPNLLRLVTALFVPSSVHEQPTTSPTEPTVSPTTDPTVPPTTNPPPAQPVELSFCATKLMSTIGPGQDEVANIINSVDALSDFRGKIGTRSGGLAAIMAQMDKYNADFFEHHSLVTVIRGVDNEQVTLNIKNISLQQTGELDVCFNRSNMDRAEEISAYWYFFVELDVKLPEDAAVLIDDVQAPFVPSVSVTVEESLCYPLRNNTTDWTDQYGSIQADGLHAMHMKMADHIQFNSIEPTAKLNWSVAPTTITVKCWDIQHYGEKDWEQYTQTVEVIDGSLSLLPGTYVYEIYATWEGNDPSIGNGYVYYPFVAEYIITESGTEGLRYELLEDGTYAVWTSYVQIGEKIVIPASYNGVRVTRIMDPGFSVVSSLEEITIPNTVTVIGEYAFSGCLYLKSLVLPRYLKAIGSRAFDSCMLLTELTIPQGVSVLESLTFAYCTNLESIHIPAGMQRIEKSAFSSCPNLKNIYFDGTMAQWNAMEIHAESGLHVLEYVVHCSDGDIVKVFPETDKGSEGLLFTKLDDGTFGVKAGKEALELTEIVIPSTHFGIPVTQILSEGFKGAKNMVSITIPDSITSIGDSAFLACSSLESVVIPYRVTSIKYETFRGCTSLTSVVLPENLLRISNEAFRGCESLVNISIPDSVYGIDSYAFSGCDALRLNEYGSGLYLGNENNPYLVLVQVSDPNVSPLTVHPDMKVVACQIKTAYCTEYDNAYYLGTNDNPYAFLYQAKTEEITSCIIHPDTNMICMGAFLSCEKLSEIIIPDGVTQIGAYAFNYCDSLENVTVGRGVTSIGICAFSNSLKLSSITLPDTVTFLSQYAFVYCGRLLDVYYEGTMEQWGNIRQELYEADWYWNLWITGYTVHCSDGDIKTEHIDPEDSVDGLVFELLPDGTYGVRLEANANPQSVRIPAIHNGIIVTQILPYGFKSSFNLRSCSLPAYLTTIGEGAFAGCTKLSGITIPNGVISIGASAFEGCKEFEGLSIPGSVRSIGPKAFNGCIALERINIAEGFTRIDSFAFEGCSALMWFYLPNSLTFIAEKAFWGCTELRHIDFEGTTAQWEAIAKETGWEYGTGLYGIGCIDGSHKLDFAGTYGLYYEMLEDGTLGVKVGSALLTSTDVVIPSSFHGVAVTQILPKGFDGARNLASVVIPESITLIGSEAFDNCENLECISIPNSVTEIGRNAFSCCYKLESIIIPSSVTTIRYGAFSNCRGLTSMVIPDTVITLDGGIFSGCFNLTTVSLPVSLTVIGGSMFSSCSRLTDIDIPEGVTRIGSSSFSGCKGLTSIILPKGLTYIGQGAFSSCSSLINIVIPDGVTSIDMYTFRDCSSLLDVTIPSGVKTIGDGAFYGCSSLTAIDLPNGLTAIASSTFMYCSSLTKIEIPDGVTGIWRHAFYCCRKLETVVLPNSLTTIDSYAFEECTALVSITLPADLTSIDLNAFRGCNQLKEIHFGGTIAQWQTISKNGWVNGTDNYVIYCTDGEIKKKT